MKPLTRLVGVTMERLKKMFYVRLFGEISADWAEATAALHAELEVKAAEYDRAGLRGPAERLRIAAAQLGGVACLDRLDADLERLLVPDAFSLPEHVEPAPTAVVNPVALPSEPTHVVNPEPANRVGMNRTRKPAVDTTTNGRRTETLP